MLPYFPRPGDDELFSSMCGRYHRHSTNVSSKTTMLELLGATTACAVYDLPNRLDYLVSQLHCATLLTADRIINDHTMLPLYRPFLPQHRVNKITSWMKASNHGSNINMGIGIMASTVPAPRTFRYCMKCLTDDQWEYGELYWHRSHQATGVRICHIHDNWLFASSIPIKSQNRHQFQPAPLFLSSNDGKSLFVDHHAAEYVSIAKEVAWLLRSPAELVLGLAGLRKRHLHHLQRLDLATYSGRVHQTELIESFVSRFGEELLKDLHCVVDQQSQDNWLSRLVRKPDNSSHPLHHILLVHFLGLTLEEFFNTKETVNRPFGRGPWPCLNQVADHYRQPVIHHITITRNSETGKPVGNFVCSCGFCYARTGPDTCKTDRYRIGRMIQFGSVWEKALFDLRVNQKRGLRETARQLGVDAHTAKFHLDILTAGKSEGEQSSSGDQQRDEHRSRWLTLRIAHPDFGRKMLRSVASADYAWLYKHDLEWLRENMPLSLPPNQGGCLRVNWGRRDWNMASRLKAAATDIRNLPGKPVRVTVSAIGKKIDALALLQSKLAKLPITASRLSKLCEERDEYHARCIRKAAERLKTKNEPLQSWRIVQEAHLAPLGSSRPHLAW